MNKLKAKIASVLSLLVVFVGFTSPAFAAVGDQGVDWSVYQGDQGQFGYANDKFALIQIGGYNANGLYNQHTYSSQVQSAIAQGKRAHTYVWFDTWGDLGIAKRTMDYFLPKIQTPKGSIVALDVEGGVLASIPDGYGGYTSTAAEKQANTETVLYGMRRIRDAGYTPMYYSGKPFTLKHINYDQIIAEFPGSGWIAAYPNYLVTPTPNYNYFPSMDDVAIFQFTSTYVAGGLDGNIDLTGITDNGYTTNVGQKPTEPVAPSTPAAPSATFSVGNTVKVKASASNYSTGEAIPAWVKGRSYEVIQTANNKVLLDGVYSWFNVGDIESGTAQATPAPPTNVQTHVVKSGDTLSGIAAAWGTSYQSLAAYNGISNPNVLSIGQVINYSTGSPVTYTVRSGDNLSVIAQSLGTTVSHLVSANGLSNPNLIYPGQVLRY